DAWDFLAQMNLIELEAKDNLTLAKVVQAYHADKFHGPCKLFEVGDLVLLSTWNRQDIFKKTGKKHVTK
ncbi:hypothetical protein BDP27DRAFT_1177129, partial [Rhodocollybia butyracea]